METATKQACANCGYETRDGEVVERDGEHVWLCSSCVKTDRFIASVGGWLRRRTRKPVAAPEGETTG